MKIKNKSKLLHFILPILFLLLHFTVYVSDDIEFFDGFILLSPEVQTFDIEKIVHTKTIYPDYLHPLQKLERHYEGKSSGETVIIEKGRFFSTDMDIIIGDPTDYYDENLDGMFLRGFAVDDYANALFFLVQYLLIIAFVFISMKKIIRNKKR